MEFRNLNTFIQVAEVGSFTKASEKLGFSQPTVSFQIKQLENELGVRLFDRIGHTVSLTDRGREALVYAQKICHMSQEMMKFTDDEIEAEGVVRLAMADSLCTPLIVKKFADFRRMYPKVSLHITTAGTDELFRLLDYNEADLVCTLDNHIYSNVYIISNEEKVGAHFVCSVDNPLSKLSSITVNDLLKEAFLLTEKGMSYRRHLDEQFATMSIEITPVLEISSADAICELVQENMGISFLPDYVTAKAVRDNKIKRLEVEGFEVELWKQIIYHRDKWVSLQMQAAIEHISQITLNV